MASTQGSLKSTPMHRHVPGIFACRPAGTCAGEVGASVARRAPIGRTARGPRPTGQRGHMGPCGGTAQEDRAGRMASGMAHPSLSGDGPRLRPVRGRPWPSVETRRCAPTVLSVHADRPNRTDVRPLCVRGQRNMTAYSATRRHTMGQSRNAPLAREFAASGAFSQVVAGVVAGVGFEPT